MRKVLVVFVLFLIVSCNPLKQFYEKGSTTFSEPTQKINLKHQRGLTFVQAEINGKKYNFLLDTGAPTVISNEIYQSLNLKPYKVGSIKDSQNNTQKQNMTVLPEMRIDGITFTNVGSIVMDLHSFPFKCFKIDGILGANQMAKLYWKIDYEKNIAEVTNDISNFDLTGFNQKIPFIPKVQKTPMIRTNLLGETISFTFDTGFSGLLQLNRKPDDVLKKMDEHKTVKTFGASSYGAFGIEKESEGLYFRSDKIAFGDLELKNQIIRLGNDNLLGNEFLYNFQYILDWKNNQILLKETRKLKSELNTFGFVWNLVNNQAIITLTYKIDGFPLKIGDRVLKINNVNLENLNSENVCEYFNSDILSKSEVIKIKISRNNVENDYELKKQKFLNN